MDRRSVAEVIKSVLADITRNDAVREMDLDTSLREELGIELDDLVGLPDGVGR